MGITLCLLLILILTHGGNPDPQANVEGTILMRLPKVFELVCGRTRQTHVLQLLNNRNGLKHAGQVWDKHLHRGLEELVYKQSKVDLCLCYKRGIIQLIYTDDCITAARNYTKLEEAVTELGKSFEIKDEGDVDEYLGVQIEQQGDCSYKLLQTRS